MLAQYRDKADTRTALQRVLKLSEEDFDRAFTEYVQGKARPYLQALEAAKNSDGLEKLSKDEVLALLREREDFMLHMRAGALLDAEGSEKEAADHFKRALELFPYQAGTGNVYERLAALYEKLGDNKSSASALESLVKQDENNLSALRKLAAFWAQQGDHARAGEILQMAFYVNPFDHALHTMAGEQLLALGDPPKAAKEFQMTLALKPPNEAEAHYNLARAQFAAGQKAEARRSVLRALEAAPSYDKAQELLLKISGG
jgi:tetratricopeptide (TPR) repeat protein